MYDSTRATIRIPADLATILIDAGVATGEREHRSALPEMIEQGAVVAATVITLAQGTVVVHQLEECVRMWLRQRRERSQQHVGVLEFRPRIGSPLVIPVDSPADVTRVAQAIRSLYFRPTTPAASPEDRWRSID